MNEEHQQVTTKWSSKINSKQNEDQNWGENEMKVQQKPPQRFFQAKYHRWEFLALDLVDQAILSNAYESIWETHVSLFEQKTISKKKLLPKNMDIKKV